MRAQPSSLRTNPESPILDADVAYEPRARSLTLGAPTGPGQIAYLDYGPDDRAPDLVFLHANGFNARA